MNAVAVGACRRVPAQMNFTGVGRGGYQAAKQKQSENGSSSDVSCQCPYLFSFPMRPRAADCGFRASRARGSRGARKSRRAWRLCAYDTGVQKRNATARPNRRRERDYENVERYGRQLRTASPQPTR